MTLKPRARWTVAMTAVGLLIAGAAALRPVLASDSPELAGMPSLAQFVQDATALQAALDGGDPAAMEAVIAPAYGSSHALKEALEDFALRASALGRDAVPAGGDAMEAGEAITSVLVNANLDRINTLIWIDKWLDSGETEDLEECKTRLAAVLADCQTLSTRLAPLAAKSASQPIPPVFALEIPFVDEAVPGQTLSIPVDIRNAGDVTAQELGVTLIVGDELGGGSQKTDLGALGAGERVRHSVVVTMPQSKNSVVLQVQVDASNAARPSATSAVIRVVSNTGS